MAVYAMHGQGSFNRIHGDFDSRISSESLACDSCGATFIRVNFTETSGRTGVEGDGYLLRDRRGFQPHLHDVRQLAWVGDGGLRHVERLLNLDRRRIVSGVVYFLFQSQSLHLKSGGFS